jgi:hypothetical protein
MNGTITARTSARQTHVDLELSAAAEAFFDRIASAVHDAPEHVLDLLQQLGAARAEADYLTHHSGPEEVAEWRIDSAMALVDSLRAELVAAVMDEPVTVEVHRRDALALADGLRTAADGVFVGRPAPAGGPLTVVPTARQREAGAA